MFKYILVACSFLLAYAQCYGQAELRESFPELQIKKTTQSILLDGVLDEEVWKKAEPASNFRQNFPSAEVDAKGKTEVYFTYDEEYIYIAAKCYSLSSDYMVVNRRRDYGFGQNDNITFLFDTYNDNTNALVFGMNPLGARREAVVISGGVAGNHFDNSWDNKWDGASKIYEDHWVCEMAIPFRSIRYDSNSNYWRFNCYRNDSQHNEYTSWIPIPREKILMDLSCMSKIHWEEPLPKSARNVSLIPYTSLAVSRDYEDLDQESIKSKVNVGGDAKLSISSGLNLDLTINPDFSQVEVDQQVTNLDRFEIFFPERRQFFLENADLFSKFGFGSAKPFFSRRIGIAYDSINEVNVQNTILYGARLSGKLNERTRVGLLNMHTASDASINLPGTNYTVATLEQSVFSKSNIAAILVNKQAFNSEEFGLEKNSYNRVAGLEYRLTSKNNEWFGKTAYHRVFSDTKESHKFMHSTFLVHNKKKWRYEWAHLIVGNGYDAELGFVRRKDILFVSPEIAYRIIPENGKINQHTISADLTATYKLGEDDNIVLPDFGLADYGGQVSWELSFKNRGRLNMEVNHEYVKLLDDFDPTRIQEDSIFLGAGTDYSFSNFSFNYRSDPRKDIIYTIRPTIGSFYNGNRIGVQGSLTYRIAPLGSIGIRYNYNHIDLSGNFETANLWLIGPRVDLSFSKSVFFSTFVQYNNQSDNLNINTRFQWRFAPVSDFFIVYTDNYLTDPFDQFASRNRALAMKITYWLNL